MVRENGAEDLLRLRHRLPPGQARARLRAPDRRARAPIITATWRACAPGSSPWAQPGDCLEVDADPVREPVPRRREDPDGQARGAVRDAARSCATEVGNDACRFFYLMRSHDQPLDFDLELAKSRTNENPVYYIQYAHARVASVMKQLGARGLAFDRGAGAGRRSRASTGAHEQAVLSALTRYPEVARAGRAQPRPARARALPARARQHASTPTTTPSSSSSRTPRCATRASRWCSACSRCCATASALLGVSAPETM